MSAKAGAEPIAAAALACIIGVSLAAGPAVAQDNSWLKFPGSAYASQSDPSDKAFIKEWEATPPKGYPTLSPANVAAMKAAIKRYTDIVAAGGWQSLPDIQLQVGMSHPAVATLRERLLLSGDLKEQVRSIRCVF
jgi:murein L,D-transpeptidase YcbB/YkuD